MINHHKEFITENNRKYLLFLYLSDNVKDDLHIQKIIESCEMVKIIEMEASFTIADPSKYYPYYNPGTPVNKVCY